MAGREARLKKTKTDEHAVTVPGTETALDLSSLSAHVAMELAAQLSDAPAIRERYGISEDQWLVLSRTPIFREMLKEAIVKLRGDLNSGKRITLKSEVALEDSIPVLYNLAHDADIRAEARIEAIKTMAQLSGRNSKEGQQAAAGSGFNIAIQINTGEEQKTVNVSNK
jgi:hypothetical protein